MAQVLAAKIERENIYLKIVLADFKLNL